MPMAEERIQDGLTFAFIRVTNTILARSPYSHCAKNQGDSGLLGCHSAYVDRGRYLTEESIRSLKIWCQ
jgi:hypothetical protein